MATDSVTVSPTYNGDSVSLTAGMIVRLKPGVNNNVVRAQADSAPHVQGVNGVVISGASAPGSAVLCACIGRETVQMEGGLTLNVGDTVYVSPNIAGNGTNVLPAEVSAIGTVADTTNYTRLGTIEADVNVSAVTPASVAGVSSVNTQKPGDSVVPNVGAAIIKGGGWARVANIAALAALSAANFPIGNSWCWVDTVGAWFSLQISALATTPTTVITASGLGGAQWLRMNWINPVWQAVTSWTVNTATGNDEAAGTVGAPLLTLSELARRIAWAQITAALTVSITGAPTGPDKPFFTFLVNTVAGGFVTFNFVPTTIYTGTVTTYTAQTPAPSTDDPELKDTGITGGSFTAAGLMAAGVLGSTTTGASRTFFFAKDLGTTTARLHVPYTGSADGSLTNGQGYKAQQLTTITQMRFLEQTPEAIEISNALIPSGTAWNDLSVFFVNCWVVNANTGPIPFLNCAFSGNGNFQGSAPSASQLIFNSCMFRGTGHGQFLIFGSSNASMNFSTTLQGAWLLFQTGTTIVITGDVRAYDYTGGAGTAPLFASYWSFVVWSVGGVRDGRLEQHDSCRCRSHVTDRARHQSQLAGRLEHERDAD